MHLRLRPRAHRGLLIVAALATGLLGFGATPAHSADAWLMGSRWAPATATSGERTDTSLGAQSLGRELGRIGYRSTTVQHGVRPGVALKAGRDAEVWGVFAHAGPGYALTGEPRSFLVAGIPGATYSDSRTWSELPDFALDGMRLAILGGCKTAVRSPIYGSFLDHGKRLGVDSVIGFRKDIHFAPYRRFTSGNLFWARFGAHARAGASVSVAMQRARADLHRRSGRSWGFDSYVIGGAALRPGSVRLRPARAGVRQAPPPSPTALALEAGDVKSAKAANSGQIRLSRAAARTVGERRLGEDVSWFSGEDMVLTSQRSVSHLPGEKLLSLTFRSRLGRVAGPASAEIEVDRRTGRIVYASAARTRPRTVHPRVGRDKAIAAARRATRASSPPTSVTPDVWDRPRWTIGFADAEAVVDGSTGSVVSISGPATADPQDPR